MRAGFEALDMPVPWTDTVDWDHDTKLRDMLYGQFLPGVAELHELDPVTTEVVRLRGARQHNCRMCKARRESDALDAGGSETMYEQIDHYGTADLLTDRHKAALRYVDALIWTPAAIASDVVVGVRTHFSEAQAFELTVDVMHNAANKIAVSLAADAP
jgi:alkylhydroperoxidase family enzyme